MSDVMTGGLEATRDAGLTTWGGMMDFGLKILDAVPEDKWLATAGEGTNHAMWCAGHLALTYGMFIEMMGGENPVPESYKPLFDHKTEPLTDAGAYPAPGAVRATLGAARDALIAGLRGQSAEELAQPLPEIFQDICPTRAHIPLFCNFHDGFHLGQVASVRKALGMPALMG